MRVSVLELTSRPSMASFLPPSRILTSAPVERSQMWISLANCEDPVPVGPKVARNEFWRGNGFHPCKHRHLSRTCIDILAIAAEVAVAPRIPRDQVLEPVVQVVHNARLLLVASIRTTGGEDQAVHPDGSVVAIDDKAGTAWIKLHVLDGLPADFLVVNALSEREGQGSMSFGLLGGQSRVTSRYRHSRFSLDHLSQRCTHCLYWRRQSRGCVWAQSERCRPLPWWPVKGVTQESGRGEQRGTHFFWLDRAIEPWPWER